MNAQYKLMSMTEGKHIHIWKKSKWLARDGRRRYHCQTKGCDGFKFGSKAGTPE